MIVYKIILFISSAVVIILVDIPNGDYYGTYRVLTTVYSSLQEHLRVGQSQ